jgi:hypothetical protein
MAVERQRRLRVGSEVHAGERIADRHQGESITQLDMEQLPMNADD